MGWELGVWARAVSIESAPAGGGGGCGHEFGRGAHRARGLFSSSIEAGPSGSDADGRAASGELGHEGRGRRTKMASGAGLGVRG